ncbi:MAG: hypothetical protein JO342_16000 [Solirubrobacterales bacterium]|nr:hypothetical protein [Solirubrobacterales bacterium]
MSSSESCSGSEIPSGDAVVRYSAKDLIARRQRLLEMPRPVEGYPLERYIEAQHLGDVTAIATLSLRTGNTQS